jgi:transposase-like protein
MLKEFKSIIELVHAFPSEKSCIAYLELIRWKDGIAVSPYDKDSKVYKCAGIRYKCRNTNRYFSVLTGTMFEDTKLPLRKWFIAIFYVTAHKKGISSCQLARDLDITQKTAWYVLKRIQNCLGIECIECLRNEVEADETYIGGKNKNRHKDKKVENAQGRSIKDKKPVFGLAKRGGIVFAKAVENVQSETIYPIITKSLHKDTTVYTDEYGVYVNLSALFPHEIVQHGAGEYVKGKAHTNTMENYWSHLKRMIIGIHHKVSGKHLQYYVDGESFRYNTRKISESQRFNLFLQKTGHKMTYKKLINKA